VTFPLAPVYRRQGIEFRQAKAVAIWPEGDSHSGQPAVDIVFTLPGRQGEQERLNYDYLIDATGPKLNFGEIGLAAHWVKHLLHFVFIYKAKARPGWAFLPE
jgi:hypothetical protein